MDRVKEGTIQLVIKGDYQRVTGRLVKEAIERWDREGCLFDWVGEYVYWRWVRICSLN